MKRLPILITLAAMSWPVLAAGTAHAQATRTWVSGSGSDASPCSYTSPCRTFAGAISKTAINGEINCIDSAAYGAVTIVKSITIDCHDVFAGIAANTTEVTTGIVIAIMPGAANDPLRTVRLRNLNINGGGLSGSVGTRVGVFGINLVAAANVFIDDVLISGFTQMGIRDLRNSNGLLVIRNTIIRDNTGTGIEIFPATGSSVTAIIDNSHSDLNGFGLAVAAGSRATVSRSVFSGNAGAGIEADAGAQVNVNDTVISDNAVGVQAAGTIRLSNSDIMFNGTGISGAPLSFGNNRISGNTSAGSVPTLIGITSEPTGQQ